MGIQDVSLPGERDLWRDLEFRSQSVVSLSFVYVYHLTYSPNRAQNAHKRQEEGEFKVGQLYFQLFRISFLAKNIRLCMGKQ